MIPFFCVVVVVVVVVVIEKQQEKRWTRSFIASWFTFEPKKSPSAANSIPFNGIPNSANTMQNMRPGADVGAMWP